MTDDSDSIFYFAEMQLHEVIQQYVDTAMARHLRFHHGCKLRDIAKELGRHLSQFDIQQMVADSAHRGRPAVRP